jgi:hypothetical protein
MEIEETKKGADRHNEGKPEWSLVDFKSLEPLVNVLMYGCQKYDRHNWKKGLSITSVLDSLYRHINAFQSGETNDKESGLPHIGHAMANLMFIQYYLDTLPELDDRGKDNKLKEISEVVSPDETETSITNYTYPLPYLLRSAGVSQT